VSASTTVVGEADDVVEDVDEHENDLEGKPDVNFGGDVHRLFDVTPAVSGEHGLGDVRRRTDLRIAHPLHRGDLAADQDKLQTPQNDGHQLQTRVVHLFFFCPNQMTRTRRTEVDQGVVIMYILYIIHAFPHR
jgi:hypothetical protein